MTDDPYHNPPAPPTAAPAAPAPGAGDLQFDRAESAMPPSPASVAGFGPAPSAATVCAVCTRPITDYYFESGGKIVCAQCQQMIAGAEAGGSGAARFFKALLF